MKISPDESTLYFVLGCTYLTAVDLATQEVKWTTLIFRKDMLCDGSTMSFDTALAPDGTLYVGYRERLSHIAATGTVLWKISLDPDAAYDSGPTLNGGVVLSSSLVHQSWAHFFGFNGRNGTTRFTVLTYDNDWLSDEPMPLANHTAVYMGAGTALAVDTLTGAVK
jgi:outer membrane protein assembly factor BamB